MRVGVSSMIMAFASRKRWRDSESVIRGRFLVEMTDERERHEIIIDAEMR